jgi:hypothetical protein
MKRSRGFLIFSAILFAVWLGYLGFLAVTHGHWKEDLTDRVISRPQFLLSQLDVIGTLDSLDDKHVAVSRIINNVAGKELETPLEINVRNLKDCEGWQGPGEYVLALVPPDEAGKAYRVAELPRSPGSRNQTPRIYKLTPEVEAQLKVVPKAYKQQ